MVLFACEGIFAPVSKISKVVDQTPTSVTSTPRTPRLDLASRLAAKTKKEKKEREKGDEGGAQVPAGVGGLLQPSGCCLRFQARRRRPRWPVWTLKDSMWRLETRFWLPGRNTAWCVSLERPTLLQVGSTPLRR